MMLLRAGVAIARTSPFKACIFSLERPEAYVIYPSRDQHWLDNALQLMAAWRRHRWKGLSIMAAQSWGRKEGGWERETD